MKTRFTRIALPLVVGLLLLCLVIGAYAASASLPVEKKQKNPKQTIGKNWDTKGVIKRNGKPQPKKNLRDTADSAADKAAIESRPRVPGKAQLKPVESTE